MTIRVGLYVGTDWIAGVALGRKGVVWHAKADRDASASLDAELAALLQGIPRTAIGRPSVFVALGPALAQLKQLRGLPPIGGPRVLRQLIEGTPSRFFLVSDAALVVAEPIRGVDGWWVAVSAAETLASVHLACVRIGLRHVRTSPVATLLHRAFVEAPIETGIHWSDGAIDLRVVYGDHGIVSLNRECRDGGVPDTVAVGLDGPLESIGADAWCFAGAYAAARAGNSAPLSLRRADDVRRTPRQIVRRVACMAALVIGAVVTLAAPGVGAARARHRSDRAFDSLRVAAASVAKDRIALEQQQGALRQVRAFAASRRLITPLLSSLSIQLPDSTAIVALRLDTLGGTLVALTPVGAELVPAVSNTPGFGTIQLSAPITRETVGPVELQRMALRFRFTRQAVSTSARRP